MELAPALIRFMDRFYLRPLQRWIPKHTFRYACCGGLNLLLSWILYYVTFHFILNKQIVHLPYISISAHIAAFLVTFPITFLTGFWLQRHIAFQRSPLRKRVQLFRYLVSVGGSIVLNYLCLKLFVEGLRLYPTPSQMIASLTIMGYSYLMQRHFTFRGSL